MTKDIVTHIEGVQDKLSGLDLKRQSQFAAWCVNGLLNDKWIRSNLVKLTRVATAVEKVQAAVEYVWTHSQWSRDELVELNHGIDDLDWDEDDPLVDSPETQGSIELLGAANNMLTGVTDGDVTAIANCAEHVINWFNTRVDFPATDSGAVEREDLEHEYVRQDLLLEELERNPLDLGDLNMLR